MLPWAVIDRRHFRHSTPIVSSLHPQRLCVRFRLSPKSLRFNLFADPHPLNLYATIFYKNRGAWAPSFVVAARHSSLITRHCTQVLSFHTLAHFLARCKTQAVSFTPKHPGWGYPSIW